MATKRRTASVDQYGHQLTGNSITQSFNESMKRKARQKRKPSASKSLMELFFGQKGAGKSYSGLLQAAKAEDAFLKRIEEAEEHDKEYTPEVAEITDEELKELHEPARKFFAAADLYAVGGGGGGAYSSGGSGGYDMPPVTQKVPEQVKQNEGYTNYWQPPPYQPWQQQQTPQPYIWTNDNSTPWDNLTVSEKIKVRRKEKRQEVEESKKEEFKPEELRGRFCAVVTLTLHTVTHTGVLFVKKCGHWKIVDFGGNKQGGGAAGSFEAMIKKGDLKIEVHRVIYDADAPVIEETDLEIV